MENLPFELEALELAKHYQQWVIKVIKPLLGQRIFEFGAGTGNISRWLPAPELLYVSEADPELFRRLQEKLKDRMEVDGARLKVKQIDVSSGQLPEIQSQNFDTVVSFNVLEHISNDFETLNSLCDVLRKSDAAGPKRLVSVVPAHGWAFGEMDKSFGHYRRYSKKRFLEFQKSHAKDFDVSGRYMNAFGLTGWVLMGKVFKMKKFNLSSVTAFEKICKVVAPVDDFLHEKLHLPLGQSLVMTLTLKA